MDPAEIKELNDEQKSQWDRESWPKRYITTSKVNGMMCGTDPIPSGRKKRDKVGNLLLWNKKTVKQFHRYMSTHAAVVRKPMTVYRATDLFASPTKQLLEEEMKSCQYISTTTSRKYANKLNKGHLLPFLHVMEVRPGVKIYDVQQEFKTKKENREKEIIIYPKSNLTLKRAVGRTLYWKVTS
jgi:hypothetical protein